MKPSEMWNAMIGVFYIGCFFAIVGGIAYLLYGPPVTIRVPEFFGGKAATSSIPMPDPLEGAPGVLFSCAGGASLKAEFSASAVTLSLSDGRRIALPQAISASGARYANPDESFVFWNKGDTAFITENGVETYGGCVTQG